MVPKCCAVFRFVRHLPVRRYGAAHGAELRAGVGQTSGEETAGHATVPRDRYGYGDSGAALRCGMAPQPASSALDAVAGAWALMSRRFAGRDRHARHVLWPRLSDTLPTEAVERRVSQGSEQSRCAVTPHPVAPVARGSTRRARRSAARSSARRNARRRSSACRGRRRW